MLRVYLDLVVLLNFMVDYLLLLGTNRLAGFPSDWRRVFLASVLGGLYGGICLLPEFRFLGNLLWRIVFLVGISGIAFGWDRSTVRRCAVFVLLSMALGGVSMSLSRNDIPALLLSAGGMWILCRMAFGTAIGQQEYVPVQLSYGGNTVNIIALRDSGNTLRDPISGEPVLVVAADVAEKLLPLTSEQLRFPLETVSQRSLPGLRLIPYSAVGQGSSMLLGMRMEHVKIGPRTGSAIVAFAAEGLGKGTVYQALTGGAL